MIPKLFSKVSKPFNETLFNENSEVNIIILTLLLLVANFANTKWDKNAEKWLKPWHEYSSESSTQ